jgi:hypothetical protein
MADYSVTIDLNDSDTLAFLAQRSLRVYKSVGSGATGLPVVWFSENQFSKSLSFSWTENYGGFVRDGGTPTPGVSIKNFSPTSMELGQKGTADQLGNLVASRDGVAGAITIFNKSSRDWMCGMGQEVNGTLSPICAFDLGGMGESVVMMPYEKVLLVFETTNQIDTGTVVARAISASCTIELDGNNQTRTVVFRKSTGWTTNTETWATLNDNDLDLAEALIVPNSQVARRRAYG